MYRFDAEDLGQSLYTPTTVCVMIEPALRLRVAWGTQGQKNI